MSKWPPMRYAKERRKKHLTVGFLRELLEGVSDDVPVMVMVVEDSGSATLYGDKPEYDEVGANLQWKRLIRRKGPPATPDDARELTVWVYKGKRTHRPVT